MKRSSFKQKPSKPLKRTPLKRTAFKQKGTPKRVKPNKRTKLPQLSTMRNKCDKLLTPIIKEMYPVCMFNGYEKCTYTTNVAHHHFKKAESNACRYYIPNLIGLCTFCHSRLHHHEIIWSGRVVAVKGLDWLEDLERQKKVEVKVDVHWYIENYERLSKLV